MKWKTTTAVLAAASLAMVAAPSAFAATTDCTTELGNTTIAGDLTVGAGETCVLGNVVVQGSITVGDDAWLDATSATIEGDVIGTDAYGISIDGTSVGGDVVSFSEGSRAGFLYLRDLTVAGMVEAGGIDVELSDVSVDGSVSTDAANYVDVARTSVGGDATFAGSDFGVSVGGAIVGGSLTVSGSSRGVLLGANEDGSAAALGNTVGGNLVLSGNSGNVQLAGSTVGGRITLAENAPAVNFGAGNTAAGVDGDFTGTAAGAAAQGDQAVAVIVPDAREGELTWSLEGTSNLVNLGVAEEQGDHFAASGELVPVRVTDSRLSGPEWSVTAQISDFRAGDQTVSGKYLGWTPKVLENEGGAVAGAPVVSGFVSGEGLATARVLGSAAAGHPTGSSVLGADLDLQLPLSVGTGTYTATLTLTALG
ncbi:MULTISPECIES: hypothetical protein [unclassified Rathayibacter]|uniref:hypothetical protein n=1 Tax=unclassified Rathayibacter TaxID=2609250 RepID=UPI000F4B9A8E|nr:MULTISPECIES: hypothetical protein [unclassified Rathayibacter]ROP56764.1 hypothetical protein EDF45_0284 [Rathayibacter sp. PhB186]ROS55149.1 hypothetical protein EDF44_0284 [Rathayibacter sp. PhB185]